MRVDIFNLKSENEELKTRLSACQIKMGILDTPIETISIDSTVSSEDSSPDADSESEAPISVRRKSSKRKCKKDKNSRASKLSVPLQEISPKKGKIVPLEASDISTFAL